jgi:hypothetical protein
MSRGAGLGLRSWVRYYHATAAERAAGYPCDAYEIGPAKDYYRAISVQASPALTFRWLCQLRLAPYSYDWLDNRGHRSPRELTAGADQMAPGDEFLIARVRDVELGRHISGVATPNAARVFGPIALTYAVAPLPDGGCRIVVKMLLGARGWPGRLRRAMLAVGDVVMMRKQLTTLRGLAERDEGRAQAG